MTTKLDGSVPQGEALRDRELMQRVLADDAAAFSAIYDRHSRSIYRLAHRMLRERAAAEDVTQEAFVALWRSRHSYRPERGSPGSWLALDHSQPRDRRHPARSRPSARGTRDPLRSGGS